MSDEQMRVEAQLFRSYWDDGLLDLLCGIGLLAIGLGWWFDQPVLAAVAPALLVPLWGPLRRAVVEPRAGSVAFSQTRQTRTKMGLQTIFVLCVGTFLLGVGVFLYLQKADSAEPLVDLAHYIAGLPAALLAVGAMIVAQLTATARFRVYALLLVVASAVTIAMQWGPAFPMLSGGGTVTLWSLLLVVRFLRATADFDERAT